MADKSKPLRKYFGLSMILLLLIVAIIAGLLVIYNPGGIIPEEYVIETSDPVAIPNSNSDIGAPVRNLAEEEDYSDFSLVDERDLLQGCPGLDCIPSIDDPVFESVESANSWLNTDDIVFGIEINGEKKVYAQRILNWHEIVNDFVGGEPVAITFCPLCGSALAFERVVNNEIVEFGVSGKLYNSDLVMYDRSEQSYWEQLTGRAIVGPAAFRGEELKQLQLTITTWQDWSENHPNSQVLSRETGFSRNYNQYPYGTYEEDDQIWFGIANEDERLHPKEVIYGVKIEEISVAFPEEAFGQSSVLNYRLGSSNLTAERLEDGTIKVSDSNGRDYVPTRTFWFAWASFNPETELYSN